MTSRRGLTVPLQVLADGQYALVAGEITIALVMFLLYRRTRGVLSRMPENPAAVRELHRETQSRISKLDRLVFDYGVRLEIVEFQARRSMPATILSAGEARAGEGRYGIQRPERDVLVISRGVTRSTEAGILRNLQDGRKNAREIKIALGKSREHVSRMLKKLFDEGLVVREGATKPYNYSITDKGREAL